MSIVSHQTLFTELHDFLDSYILGSDRDTHTFLARFLAQARRGYIVSPVPIVTHSRYYVDDSKS